MKAKLFKAITFLILITVLSSCATKDTKPVYLIENFQNTATTINGPLKGYQAFYINNNTDEQLNGLHRFDTPHFTKEPRARYYVIDSLGGLIKDPSPGARYPRKEFFKPMPSTIQGATFLRHFALSEDLSGIENFQKDYHWHVLQPLPIRRDEISFKRRGEDNWLESSYKKNDTSGIERYFYKLNEKDQIIERKHLGGFFSSTYRDFTYNSFYSGVTVFEYNEKGLIIRETTSCNRDVEPDFDKRTLKVDWDDRGSFKVNGIYFKRDAVAVFEYEYDDRNRVIKTRLIIDTALAFTEEYYYRADNSLKKKILYSDEPERSGLCRTHKGVYHYNERGLFSHLEEFDDKGNMVAQQWMDYHDFDQYGNWGRCEYYLSGSHSGTPDITGYRKLHYYK